MHGQSKEEQKGQSSQEIINHKYDIDPRSEDRFRRRETVLFVCMLDLAASTMNRIIIYILSDSLS